MLQQAANFLKGVGNQLSWKSVAVAPVREILRQSVQVVHVFREILRDMRLQNLENTALLMCTPGNSPSKAHDRTDACLRKNGPFDIDLVGFEPRPQVPRNDAANFRRLCVTNSIFQSGESLA